MADSGARTQAIQEQCLVEARDHQHGSSAWTALHAAADALARLTRELEEAQRERDEAREGERHSLYENEEATERCRNAEATTGRLLVKLEQAEQRAEALARALRPFALFAEKWEANPIRGLADELYTIHSGDQEAVLRLSDCQRARRILSSPSAGPDATGGTT